MLANGLSTSSFICPYAGIGRQARLRIVCSIGRPGSTPGMDMKYTRERVEAAAKVSDSIAGVMRELGIQKPSGGIYNHIGRRLREWDIDTSHFLGQGSRLGRIPPNKKPPEHFLCRKEGGGRVEGRKLRRALIEIGRSYRCESCLNEGVWMDAPMVLEVDHIDNDWRNNEADNLRFLCPNCHSQR